MVAVRFPTSQPLLLPHNNYYVEKRNAVKDLIELRGATSPSLERLPPDPIHIVKGSLVNQLYRTSTYSLLKRDMHCNAKILTLYQQHGYMKAHFVG